MALRTLRSLRQYSSLAFAAKISHNNHVNRSLVPRFHFSSESKKHGSDELLLRVIDEEIKSAKESEDHSLFDELPGNFPFEIHDNPGHQTITLKRTYQDEDIQVVVHMPNLVTSGENDVEDTDEDRERALQSTVPLVVNVTKKGGESSLEFVCTVYDDKIAIESLLVKDKDSASDQNPYDGPAFTDLDENLQKSFDKYLEIRGIRPSTTGFLHEYMIDKDNKEYLSWLHKVKKFIQA